MKRITIWEEPKSGEIILLYASDDRTRIDAMVYKSQGDGVWTRYEAQDVNPDFIVKLCPLREDRKKIVETVWGLYKRAFPDQVGKIELDWAIFPQGNIIYV